MTDSRDDFEFLDGDALGEEPCDPGLPGTYDFPPNRALGADDPSVDNPDDLSTRDLRRHVESKDQFPGFVLATPDGDGYGDGYVDGYTDEEAQEIGVAVDATDYDLAPEEAALHLIDPLSETSWETPS